MAGRARARGGRVRGHVRGLSLAGLMANAGAVAALAVLASVHMDDPTQHARDALHGVLAGHAGLHALIGAGFAAFALDQARRGEITAHHAGALPTWRLWQDFAAITTPISALLALGIGA